MNTTAHTRSKLKSLIDEAALLEAIRGAEARTSGEIRVSLAPFFWGSVERAARRAFERLGMSETREHNGVLFFLVTSRRRFVVLGDAGIHERVGPDFWRDLARALAPFFRRGEFTAGLVAGIDAVADELARHFPADPETDRNELPDAIDRRPPP